MQANGFKVIKENVKGTELLEIKAKHKVPSRLFSCHTALIDGYVVEGHVPADVIKKMLKEKPSVLGLGVPGMPIGSPGMEGPNPQPYEIFTFDERGRVAVYARKK